MKNHILITIPRCGSHLLDRMLIEEFGTSPDRTHDVDIETDKEIMTIARQPRDFIVSELAMTLHYTYSLSDLNYGWIHSFLGERTDAFGKQIQTLIDRSSVVLKYDDLVNKPSQVIDYLATVFDTPRIGPFKINYLQDKPEVGYLVSSKTSGFYDYINKIADGIDFTEINKVYTQLLDMSVDIA